MIEFNFNIKPINRKVFKSGKRYVYNKSKKIEGVIFIDENANYYVRTNDKIKYDIAKSSYNCKNKKVIYSKYLDKNKNRISLIRSEDYMPSRSNYTYLPFAVGCKVKCKLTFDNKAEIISCTTDNYSESCAEALNELRNNYKTLKPLIKNKQWYIDE